jgi:hypothetical protein
MSISLHDLSIDTFVSRLQTLAHLLARGAAKLDPAVMVGLRLAPDMHPLARQVQFVCNQALDASAWLTGRAPHTPETPEETLEQLQRRITATIAALRDIPADALVGGEDRPVRRPLGDRYTLEMSGLRYLRDFTLPNFYFHLITTYAILRANGVELGKADYMGHIMDALRPAQ